MLRSGSSRTVSALAVAAAFHLLTGLPMSIMTAPVAPVPVLVAGALGVCFAVIVIMC